MKKTFGMLCAAIICTTGIFAMEETSQPITTEQANKEEMSLGKDSISQIRKEYREGRYDSFLKEMDDSYEQVLASHKIDEFAQLRSGDEISPDIIAQMQALQEERHTRVMQVLGNDDSFFAQKVRSAIPSLDLITDNFFFRMHQMLPGSGVNQDENTCIDLDVEYDYKVAHLASFGLEDVRSLYYALKMEQMDKLSLAAQSFEDEHLKQVVANVQENFDDRLSQNWDMTDLYSLMREKSAPLGSLEKKVIAILQAHQSHLADLEKSEF